MGRVWDFLNRDAGEAVDRLLTPYVNFILRHTLWLYIIYAAGFGLIWIFVSKTVGLVGLAVAALGIALVILEHAAALWRRRNRP
jgi:hypothetical protein